MKYLSVKERAALWNTSERSVRNYCSAGRVPCGVVEEQQLYACCNSRRQGYERLKTVKLKNGGARQLVPL